MLSHALFGRAKKRIHVELAKLGIVTYYYEWMLSLNEGRSSLEDQQPWITFGTRDFLKKKLKSSFTVFEYGSGGSTLFLSRRVKQAISVEHDPEWFQHTQAAIQKHGLTNCEVVLVPSDPKPYAEHSDPSDPQTYASALPSFVEHNFYNYVTVIDQYPDDSFDLVIVDGRSRPACIKHAQSKVRPGGYLLLDNSEREWYQDGIRLLYGWKKRHVSFGLVPYNRSKAQTTIFQKP